MARSPEGLGSPSSTATSMTPAARGGAASESTTRAARAPRSPQRSRRSGVKRMSASTSAWLELSRSARQTHESHALQQLTHATGPRALVHERHLNIDLLDEPG